ncbi:MAG TPA: hypothetical protein VFE36_12850 [Candidatus Baltobacteraceae bacterium]|jgi:hypothetical protein|nr:hypothetical protein [Candidatus Baltobacteraceae bacterium]
MKRLILLVISAALAASLTGMASAQQTQPGPAQPATATGGGTITLNPPNKQGPTGSAQIAQQGDDVVITLHAPADETTAAVFSGTCMPNGKPQATGPATALQRLANGTSQTTLQHTKVTDLASTPHAIVVQGGNVAPLCGDVSAITTAAPKP